MKTTRKWYLRIASLVMAFLLGIGLIPLNGGVSADETTPLITITDSSGTAILDSAGTYYSVLSGLFVGENLILKAEVSPDTVADMELEWKIVYEGDIEFAKIANISEDTHTIEVELLRKGNITITCTSKEDNTISCSVSPSINLPSAIASFYNKMNNQIKNKMVNETLSLSDESNVTSIRATYDALDDEYKELADMKEMYEYLVAAEAKIESLKLEEYLANLDIDALLEDYVLTDYRAAQQAELLAIVTNVQTSLASATTVAEAQAIIANAQEAAAAVKTDAQLTAEEKATAASSANASSSTTATTDTTETTAAASKETTATTEETTSVKVAKAKIKKAKASKKAVKLTWKKVADADGYEVYRATSKKGTYKKVKTLAKTSLKDKKVKSGKKYYYKVRAYKVVNGKKVYGNYSKVKKVKVK